MTCSRCNKQFGGALTFLTVDLAKGALCPDCEEQGRQRALDIAQRAERILVTTTPSIEGHRIVAYLGIESVEIVIGTGFFSELTGDISDFLGQRSRAFENKLSDAKRIAFDRLKTRAVEKNANAVIGIDLDYTEFSGNRVGLIVNGTLVRAVPIAKTAE
jgi:uncharacterized protein YbjQ (UPF0145 family)